MTLKRLAECRKCKLCLNQLPLIDKKEKCDVMWVGLSAKKVNDINNNYPLEEDTNSGKIIKEIEDSLPNVNYYKTNLVKCLPLDNEGKIRYPSNEEMIICIKNLIIEIEFLKPRIVFLLGNNVANFVKKYISENNIELNVILKKIEHPSYIYIYKRKNKQLYIDKVINDINGALKK